MNTVTILQGHVIDKLRELPENSVHCVITSPPYWGLRDYGIEPQVWGGEEGCGHEWGKSLEHKGGTGGHNPKQNSNKGSWQEGETNRGNFCHICSAWRGSYGLEPTIELYVQHTVEIFQEVRRVLRQDGVCFLNLGDSYCSQGGLHDGRSDNQSGVGAKRIWRDGCGRADGIVDSRGQRNRNGNAVPGLKPKDLCGLPWRVALALQADGWWLRSDIIWAKPNPMPESVTDRPTRSHEYIFLLTKSAKYFWDQDAVREEQTGNSHSKGSKLHPPIEDAGIGHKDWHKHTPDIHVPGGRNCRTVWTIATAPFPEAHFATFPPSLVEKCIKAGTSEKGVCPKCGAPWARVVEKEYVGTNDGHKHKYKNKGKHSGYVCTNGEVLNIKTQTLYWKPSCICPIPELTSPVDFLKRATVLDPFMGSGTTCLVAAKLGRDSIGIELKPEYIDMAKKRLKQELGMLVEIKS